MTEFWVWLVLAVLFFVAEMLTTGFVLMWLGMGALVAALLAFTHLAGFGLQMSAFLVVSVGLIVASRTIFERLLPTADGGRRLKTGIENLPGQVGVVVEPSAADTGEAAVRVFGSVWRAFPAQDELPLRKGERVQVERIEGVSVFVRRAGHGPSWRLGARGSDGAARQLGE
jgi:inner membrane protein